VRVALIDMCLKTINNARELRKLPDSALLVFGIRLASTGFSGKKAPGLVFASVFRCETLK